MRAELGKTPSRAPPSQLNLPPGFRFYPTDEELVVHYLCRKAALEPFGVPIIAEVELYKFNPWDLPDKALFGEREWYFFSPRDRKYPNGSRPNRAAGSGYWKATGTDKPIHTGGCKKVGVKKALVFYKGKAPKGVKTNWIMHEYRLADSAARSAKRKGSLRLDDWVLCRIYKKSSSEKTTLGVKTEPSSLDQQVEDSIAQPEIPTSNVAEMTSFYANEFANGLNGQQVANIPQFAQGYNRYNGHMDHTGTASSMELSDHHGFGSRQQSSTPESLTIQESDDAVESTFTMPGAMPGSGPISGATHTGRPTPLNVQNCFPYGGPLDATTTNLISPGTFAGLVDSSDYNFFSSHQDYTSLLTGRPGPHVTSAWDLLRPSQH